MWFPKEARLRKTSYCVSLWIDRACSRIPTVKYFQPWKESSVFSLHIPRTSLAIAALMLALSLNLSFAHSMNSSNGRSTLNGSAPTWANSNNYKGPADPTTYVGFRVYLGWNNPSQVEALAQAVSDPKSSSYGQYLTPQQFRQEFQFT